MLGSVAKFLLVLSAMAPIAVVYSWVAYQDNRFYVAIILVIICVILVLVCILVLDQSKAKLERFPFKPVSVEAADRENVAYLLLYLSPLFTDKLSDLNVSIIAPTMIIFALLSSTGNSYHFNPLLGLFGWHFYKVASTEGVVYVLITKKHLRNTSQISQVGQLTDYILIDLEATHAG
jgi:hypothetical protein